MKTEKTERGWSRGWTYIALIWAILLYLVPDPRPLATRDWTIKLVSSLLHLPEPAARVVAAIAVNMLFLGILGMLVMRASGERRFRTGAMVALVLAPVAGIITLWLNHGYFPIAAQLKLAVVATLAGALATLLLRRNWWAGLLLLAFLGLVYGMLSNYRISDDLADATRSQVKMILTSAATVPDGDEGCLQLTRAAFDMAAQRSRAGDPVLQNQAAVLGLALVLGDEKLAKVADRYVDPARIPLCEKIRARTTLHQRADWSRHFWVSAGLVILSGDSRALNVGLIKEVKDANAGGSGFSFGDLTADAAGSQFAQAATRDVAAAVAMQQRLKEGAVTTTDLMPEASDLPEGINADDFEKQYGGAGGTRTDSLVQVIKKRLDPSSLLH